MKHFKLDGWSNACCDPFEQQHKFDLVGPWKGEILMSIKDTGQRRVGDGNINLFVLCEIR